MTFPLLGKELTEQAARKRTYFVRVGYATALFLVFAILFRSETAHFGAWGWPYMLGVGRELFNMLVGLQFAGIFLFLPAMMSGVLTVEKEQASLGLLFLTDMRPWELLIQKYLGRLIPMFSFLLLAMPLTAIAYSLGGIATDHLFSAVWMLLLTSLQVGAFALMASAICQTTVGAFLFAYLGGTLFYLLPLLLLGFFQFTGRFLRATGELTLFHFPPYVFFDAIRNGPSQVLMRSLPIVLSTVLFLILARVSLVRRAFLPPRNPLIALFRKLDRLYARWNSKLGGIVLWRAGEALPDDEPVAWRELERRALGRAHYLFRILVVIEGPLLFIGPATLLNHAYGGHPGSAMMLTFVIWILTALTLAVQGANALVAERTHQTLDVLLATPLSGEEIVRQKMRALRRLCVVFAVPLLTMAAMTTASGASLRWWNFPPAAYAVQTVLAVAIYLPLMAWVSFWIGMKVRTRFRAIMTSLIVLVVWCALGPFLAVMLDVSRHEESALFGVLTVLSPASAVVLTETDSWQAVFDGVAPAAVFLNFLLYGGILFSVRRRCIGQAERYLRGE